MLRKNKIEKEFWSPLLIEKSWQELQKLKKNYNFILIGGWAVYLLTQQLKSKDLDIIVSLEELEKFKKTEQSNLRKNDRLKKYEIKKEETDIDIYVEYFSKLTLPTEDIKRYILKTQGFVIARPEVLLILKQGAYKNRENSVKGEKDKIDIISLLFFSDIDFNKYYKILKKYKIEHHVDELKKFLVIFKNYQALNLSPREFKIKKNKILKGLKKI